MRLGGYNEALRCYHESIKLDLASNNILGVAATTNNLGLLYHRRGDLQLALYQFKKAASFWESAKESNDIPDLKKAAIIGLARTTHSCGAIFIDLEEPQKAVQYFQYALGLIRNTTAGSTEAAILNNLGAVYLNQGEYEKAIEYFMQAIPLREKLQQRAGVATILNNLGKTYNKLGNYPDAQKNFENALSIFKDLGLPRKEAYTLLNQGILNCELGNYQKGLDNYNQALFIFNQLGDQIGRFKGFGEIAKLKDRIGNLDEAFTNIDIALSIIDSVQTEFVSDDLRSSYLASVNEYYQFMMNLLIKLYERTKSKKYIEDAFYISERSRARSLLDLVNEGGIFQFLDEIESDFRIRFLANLKEQELWRDKYFKAVSKNDSTRIQVIEGRIDYLEENQQKLFDELRTKYPYYYQLITPEIFTLKKTQNIILKQNQTLIEYFVGDSATYVWTITKDKFYFQKIQLTRYELRQRFSEISPLFRGKLKSLELVSKMPSTSEPAVLQKSAVWADLIVNSDKLLSLYHELFNNPFENELDSNTELIIVPDDVLYYFPFELMVTKINNGRVAYLCEKYPILYGYSASMLNPVLYRSSTPASNILAFGNPEFNSEKQPSVIESVTSKIADFFSFRGDEYIELPFAEDEVDRVSHLFNNRLVRKNANATESLFKQKAADYSIIHLATHNILDDVNPLHSRIVLSQVDPDTTEDGFLHTYELFNLPLKAQMVVLSACDTGLGKLKRGEGLMGMTRAFLYAGVPNLVVSLWGVNDTTTPELMENFYKKLKEGRSISKAMQTAKIELIKKEIDPFYWAPFIVIGNSTDLHLN